MSTFVGTKNSVYNIFQDLTLTLLKTSTSKHHSNLVLAIYASLFCVKLRTTSSFVAQMKHDNHKLPSNASRTYKFKSEIPLVTLDTYVVYIQQTLEFVEISQSMHT